MVDWGAGKDCLCCWQHHEKVCSVHHLVMPKSLEQHIHKYGFRLYITHKLHAETKCMRTG